MKKHILIGLSGGPSVAINASMAGVMKAAMESGQYDHIYGALHGVEGVLNGDIIDLSPFCSMSSLRCLCRHRQWHSAPAAKNFLPKSFGKWKKFSSSMESVYFSISAEMIRWIRS